MVHLGHRIGGADFTVQQRLQPALFLRGRAHPLQHFHVAGIGRRAVHALGSQGVFTQLRRNVSVVQVGQSFTRLRVRQEEIPQAFFFGLVFGSVQYFKLARRIGPPVSPRAPCTQGLVLFVRRIGGFLYEPLDMLVQRNGLLRHAQIVEVIVRAQGKGRRDFGCGDCGHGDVFSFNGVRRGGRSWHHSGAADNSRTARAFSQRCLHIPALQNVR